MAIYYICEKNEYLKACQHIKTIRSFTRIVLQLVQKFLFNCRYTFSAYFNTTFIMLVCIHVRQIETFQNTPTLTFAHPNTSCLCNDANKSFCWVPEVQHLLYELVRNIAHHFFALVSANRNHICSHENIHPRSSRNLLYKILHDQIAVCPAIQIMFAAPLSPAARAVMCSKAGHQVLET